jgi:hypothetical protein
MKLNATKKMVVDESDWSSFVSDVYKRPYCFQQQEGCKPRGVFEFSVPISNPYDNLNITVPETTYTNTEGVSFKSWLERDPTLKLKPKKDNDPDSLEMWWHRNFYPDVEILIDDLHKRGLLEEGEYLINIDW